MKTYNLIAIILITLQGFSQMVVNDPSANNTLIAQLSNGAKQLESSIRQIEVLEKTHDIVSKVNTAVETVSYLKDITSIYKQIMEDVANDLHGIQDTNSFSSNEMNIISKNFIRFLNMSSSLFKIAEDLLKNGIFNMNDAERLSMLKESKTEMHNVLTEAKLLNNKYFRIAKDRQLKAQLFKN